MPFRACYLPERLRLEWKRDQLTLDVALKDVIVNQFDSSLAAQIFVAPVIPGYKRVNLADMARSDSERQPHDSAANAARCPRRGME